MLARSHVAVGDQRVDRRPGLVCQRADALERLPQVFMPHVGRASWSMAMRVKGSIAAGLFGDAGIRTGRRIGVIDPCRRKREWRAGDAAHLLEDEAGDIRVSQARRCKIDADFWFGDDLPGRRPGIENDQVPATGDVLRQADGQDEVLAERAAETMQDDRATSAKFGFDERAIDREVGADVVRAPGSRPPAAMQAGIDLKSSIITDA